MSDALRSLAQHFGDVFPQLRDAQTKREAEAAAATAFEKIRVANAGNLAERHALRRALASLDPKHPLLSEAVREQVLQAGRDAFQRTRDWGAVRDAGEQFAVDPA